MKKKRLIIPIVLVTMIVIALTAYAYLKDNGGLQNKVSIGENTVGIDENFEPPKELKSGDNIFKKEIQIENTGNIECYVRVFLDFSDSTVKDAAQMQATEDGPYINAAEYEKNPPDGWAYIPISENETLGGYYYYKEPIQPGETTNLLLNQVKVRFDSDADIKDFDIIVSADSVQTKNKDGKAFDDYESCWNEYMTRKTVD